LKSNTKIIAEQSVGLSNSQITLANMWIILLKKQNIVADVYL
jgi:hypothetical protein